MRGKQLPLRFALVFVCVLFSMSLTATANADDHSCGTRALVIDAMAGLRAVGAIGTPGSATEETDVAIRSAVYSCGGTYLLRPPSVDVPYRRIDAALGLGARLLAPVVRSLLATRITFVGDSLAPIITQVPMRLALTFAVDDVVAWNRVVPKAARDLGLRPPRIAVREDSVQLWISAQF